MENNTQLSVVIPCYNEAKNIHHIVAKLKALLRDKPHSECEVILVNNGSIDNTAHILNEELLGIEENIRIVTVAENKGYGYGILFGLNEAKGTYLAWTHADLQTDPADVFKALDIILTNNNKPILVKGYRRNRKWSEALFSSCMAIISSIVLRKRLTEINAQPKLFHRYFYDTIKDNAPYDFSLDLYFLYHAKSRGKIVDFPVFFLPRLYGEAKGGSGSSFKVKFKLIKRTLLYIFQLNSRLNNK